MTARRSRLLLLGLGLVAAVLTSCTAAPPSAPDAAVPTVADDAAPADGGSTPDTSASAGDYPTCDEVFTALGPEAATLVVLPGTENGEKDGSQGRELSCTWMSPATAAQSTDLVNYGGISLGIGHDPTYIEDDYAPLGWNIDDPRLAADDAWALTAGGGYDPGAQVSIKSVQVVRDGTVVTIAGGGVAFQDVPELAALTEGWAVGAGLAVLDLMR